MRRPWPRPKAQKPNLKAGKLPSKQEILDFLQAASAKVGKREIARVFGVSADRIALKELLRDMADDGLIAGSRRKLERPGSLPSVTVLEIVAPRWGVHRLPLQLG
jgi:ribonuclease R